MKENRQTADGKAKRLLNLKGGSRKGKPNKLTTDVRAAIQEAFNRVGGADYLVRQADENPAGFCKLIGMTLPKEVKLDATVNLIDLLAKARESSQPPQ